MSTPITFIGEYPLGYIKAHVVNLGRITPTTKGQLCAGKVLNSSPPPGVWQQETEQSQCNVALLLETEIVYSLQKPDFVTVKGL